MRDRINAIARRAAATFGSFTPGQRAITVLGTVVLVVAGYLFATWAGKPTYAPLFSNLAATDASSIVDKLATTGTPYQLADGGSTILVPQNQVYDVRLKMAGQGLPAQADSGYALLDKQGITTSEFMQNVDYQRALEGELSKTIKAIGGIQVAVVHLAIPQKDIFSDDQQKPTASVLIASAPGSAPTQNQVQAIVHLVAASVVGLDPTQVTVADATGAVLSTGDGTSVAADTGVRSQQTQQFEQRMDTALQTMLASVVGPGHVVVQTTADLDYDKTETKTQTYIAPSPSTPPLSQNTTSETYSGAGAGAAGLLGATAAAPVGASPGSYSHTTNTQDNPVGLVSQTVNSAPGNVRRLSVAVLLDSTTAGTVPIAQIQSLVSSAAALTPSRGDTITVSALPFDQSLAKQAQRALADAKKASQQQQLMGVAKQVGLALAVGLVLFFAWRASKRAKRVELSAEETAQLERIQATIERQRSVTGPDARAALTAGDESPRDDLRQQRKLEITSLVERQPEEVAQLLRGWLAHKHA
jgi:flagellar M-ring protein FliF